MGYKVKHEGKTVELPDFGDLPTGVIRRARLEAEEDKSWFILEQTLDEDQLAVIDSLPVSTFAEHMKNWTGSVSLGES